MIQKSRLINEFSHLVSIDSVSFQEREMADYLKTELKELGFQVSEDESGPVIGGNCGNVYGFLKGELPGEPLLFSAHMDTVTPGIGKKAVVAEDGTITSAGNTVLGADDLSGIAVILEAVRSIREENTPHRDIEILFPVAEEVYLKGSNVADYSQIQSKEAYVLDLSGPVGTAALSAPTLVSFTAEFTGKASHAGFAPEEGVNAIQAAAAAISRIPQGKTDPLTTVNIGLIEGGKARNIVSDLCIVRGEVRSMDHDHALQIMEQMKHIMKQSAEQIGAEVRLEQEFGCLAYQIEDTHRTVRRFERICSSLGIPTEYMSTFGGSDNNNFYQHGIEGIVIASGMNRVHSCQEFSHAEELVRCTGIVRGMILDSDDHE